MKNNPIKRLMAMALCLCMLLSMYVPSASAATVSYHDMSMSQLLALEEDLTWVFTGDSITHNGGWTGGYNDYAAWFEKYLYDIGRGDDTLINTAWGGAAIDHFQPTRSGDDGMGLEQFVTKYNPDVVFIKLGMNNRTMSDGDFASKYNAMLDGIYAAGEANGKKPKIILLSPTPLSGEFGISSGEFGSDPTTYGYYDSVKRFSNTLSIIASQRGLQFVDLRQAMVDESAVMGDSFHYTFFSDPSDGLIHPNGAGQYFMFKTICRKLGLYDPAMSIFRVSYDEIINAPLYSDANTISYTGSYGEGTSNANNTEMNKEMPVLEKNTRPELLASVDFTDQNGTFVGGATYAGATRIDMTDADVMDDALTLAEAQALGTEFSVIFRAKLNPSNNNNQPVLFVSANGTANWNNAIALGVQGKSDQIYYEIRSNSTELTNSTNTASIDSAKTAVDGDWHTVAYVQTANNLLYYVDGVLVATKEFKLEDGNTIGSVFANATDESFAAHIGSYGENAGTYQLDGKLDYYQLYKGALDASEVAHLTTNGGKIDAAAQMDKTMPTVSDVSPLAAVDFTSATGNFAGTNAYASSTRVDLTDETAVHNALTLEEVQAMGREFSIVLRGRLDSTTNRNHQPLLLMNPGGESDWNNSIAVGGPGAFVDPNDGSTGHRLYYEVRKESQEQTSSSNGILLADTTADVRDAWHTIAIVQRTDGLDYYIDGVLAESKNFMLNDGVTFGGLFADATEVTAHVGTYAQNGSTSFNLKAKLDYYQFYGTALSAAQVQSLGSGAVTDADQMNAAMPQLPEVEYVPNLLASVDFTSENGAFVYNNADINASTVDLTVEAEGVDTLTVAEARTLQKEYSIVFRAKLNPDSSRANQPIIYLAGTSTGGFSAQKDKLLMGMPGTSNIYYQVHKDGASIANISGGTTYFGNLLTEMNDGEWHTIAIVQSAVGLTYYVDGTAYSVAKDANGTAITVNSNIGEMFADIAEEDFDAVIGRYGITDANWKTQGDFDFWQFYDGVLSAGQIQKLSVASDEETVTPAAWTDTVKANSLWAVVGADQMSGYLGETPNFSLFRLLNNGMRGGSSDGGAYRDIRMMNLAKPGQTVGDLVANYDDILGEHQSIYDVLMLLPEVPDVHASGYAHSADKVAAYKANIQTLIEKNEGKAIVLWTPLASLNATINGYITDYANAVREIVGEDPTVLLFDANKFMNEWMGTVGHNWFDDSMNITPLCATDLAYAFYVHANYPTYGSSKDPTNKAELKSHNLRYSSDTRTYKSGVIKENLSYGVSVNGGTFTVDASNIAGMGYSNLRVAVISGIGIHSVVAPWVLGSVGETLSAPHSDPIITVYGEMGGRTYRFKDVQLSLSTGNSRYEPYTSTSDLTALEVVGAPAIGFSPDKTTYDVELYQYQHQVRIVAEGGSNLSVKVDGKSVKPGNFSQYIAVNDRATVTVTVSGGAEDKTYTLNLTRPKYADIIVTEVMTDGYVNYTKSGADNYELIEIYNASGEDLNLLDYSIGYIREYPYSNDKVENGQIPYYFAGNEHNFFGNSYLGINQITKYSSYWADKVDQEPAEVIFPADSTMVIWVKFSKDAGTDYGASLTYETLISALEAHSGTHTLTVDVEENGQTVTKTIVPTQDQLVVAEIPYGAAQGNVTQRINTSATNFYMDNFSVQQDYNNRRGWLFVLDDSAVRDYYGALTEAGNDIISAAKYVRPGNTDKLSNVMYYDVNRGMSVVKNPDYWDTNFTTGHTSDQQGYANKTSFGAIEYWQKPYHFGDTTGAVISNNTPEGILRGDDAVIRLDVTDNRDIRYLELHVDADDDGTYETVIRKDVTLITSASNAGKVTDVTSYAFTHTLTEPQNTVKYYGFVLDGNNNKTELGSAEIPEVIEIIEPGQLKIDATVVNEAGEASDAELEVSITLEQGTAQEAIGSSYVIYDGDNQAVGELANGKGTVKVGNGGTLIVQGLPNGADYTLDVTVPDGYRDLTPTENLTGRIGTVTASTAVSSQKILIIGDLTVTGDVKRVNGESADVTASVVITVSRGTSPVELAESYTVVDAQGNKLGDTADNTITVSLADGQQAIVKDLPVGTTYTVTATAPEGYENLTGDIDGALTGADGATERMAVKEILITGNLTVEASVKRLNDTASDKTVTLKITLAQGDAEIAPTADYRVMNASNELLGLIRNGEGSITLGNGEKAIIQNLPAGTAYALSLTSVPEDYEDVTQTALSGNVSKDGSAASVAVKEKLVTGTLTVNAQVKKVDDTASDQNITVYIQLVQGDSLAPWTGSYDIVDGAGNVLGETLWGSATVMLGEGEKAVIAGLPTGVKYTVTVTAPAGYENTTTGETTGNMVKTGASVDVSAKEQLVTGDLTVKANVFTIYGAASMEMVDVKIELEKGNAPIDLEASYEIVDAYGKNIGTVINGTATVQVGNYQTAIVKNVAEGAAYKVTVIPSGGFEDTTTGETTGNVVKTGSTVAVSVKEKLPAGPLTVSMAIYDSTGAAADSSVKAAVKIQVVKGEATYELNESYDILNSEGTKIGTLTNGEADVELSNGGVVRIEDLPAGAAYTVTVAVPEDYDDVTTGETTGNIVVDGNDVTVALKERRREAEFNGKVYASVSEALEAARETGGIVKLIADAENGNLMIRPGITLDLNGYTLTADHIAVFNGANIVDNSADNTGLLAVDSENVIIGANNSQMPVWNGSGYVLSAIDLASLCKLDGRVEITNDQFGFAFHPLFQTTATALLSDGAEDNNVTIEVRIRWKNSLGDEYRNFVYNEDQVKTVMPTARGAFTLTVTGLSAITDISDLYVEAVVRSSTGVCITSAPIPIILQ